ncbi:MAG: FlgD immunoglobulin-like domain containing protein [Candidatus Edwardsbacteria bacterium]|nr:FlgD immunoglobulin-like domain containing protein [Candidatus Edwardsbacteria bacterium]
MKKILVSMALLNLMAGAALAGHWQMEGHLPQGPIDDMAVTGLQVAGSTMIAVIGGNSGGSAINDVYYYEIGNQNWHGSAWGVPQYPHQVYGLAAVTIPNGSADTIYPCGGYLQDLSAYGDSVYYPIWMSGWYPVPGLVMWTPRMNHGLVYIEPNVYAVGGTVFGGSVDSTVEKLNLGAHTVSGATPMPQSRTEAVVAKALGSDGEEHIYVIGGRTNSGALLNSVIEYDTSGAGGFWNGKTSMPGPGRWMATGAVLNNKIYVMGGTIDLSGNVTRRVDIYNPQTDTWTPGDSLPFGIIRAGAYGVNNVIYFFGGYGYDGAINAQIDSVWQYHPLAPNSPPLIRPINNAQINNQNPVFYWGEVPAADGYRIQVTSDPTFITIDVADYTSYSGTDTSLGGVALSPAGDFYWRVKAYNWTVPDSSLWSPVRKLTLDLTPPEKPVPSIPTDGASFNFTSINFSWAAVADAKCYRLQIDNSDGSFTTTIVDDSTIIATTTTADLSPWGQDLYTWRVEAIDSAGNHSGYHSIQTFTIDQTAPLLASTYPFSGNIGIDPNDDIILGFSEPMNPGAFIFSCSPDPGNWYYNWNATGDIVTISHAVFPSNSTITATINTAQDMAGNDFALNGHDNPWNFTTATDDVTPPSITSVKCSTDPLYAGSQYTPFTVYASDDNMESVTVYWATAGYNGYNFSRTLTEVGPSQYQTTIEGYEIGMEGVQYQVVATDSFGNVSYYPDMGDYYIHSVYLNGQSPATPFTYDKWQMISIPAYAIGSNIFGQISNLLGPYDNTKWRLYEWAGGAYHEISTISAGSISELGRAYWLNRRVGPNNITFPGAISSYGDFSQSKPCSLNLYTGWNDLGTPFMFDINWMNVAIPSGVAGPYYYDGGRWLLPTEVTANMSFASYQGFSFRNDNGAPRILEIYPTSAKKKDGKIAAKSPNGWQALVVVENQGGSDHNYFGLSSDASAQRDQYDYPEPPSGLTGTSGYFRLADDQFCTDVRPEIGEGQVWNFVVDCNGSTELAVNLPAEFPAGTECHLADLTRQVSVNIAGEKVYSFIPESGEQTREFRIIVGSGEYAKQVLGKTFSVPTATVLGQNLPNPFSGRTTISYQLAAEGRVKITVYNVAGQLVRTLLDEHQMTGRYSVAWDGRDQAGRQVSAGLYFYQLQAPNRTATRRMALVR